MSNGTLCLLGSVQDFICFPYHFYLRTSGSGLDRLIRLIPLPLVSSSLPHRHLPGPACLQLLHLLGQGLSSTPPRCWLPSTVLESFVLSFAVCMKHLTLRDKRKGLCFFLILLSHSICS
uniref:Uncharacterized protein n=1 Tax=Macaca fascicularis TaxID=9541 RepID=Q95KG2_MACFA|nr:hypothetical protein [Macaca fascicularis]